MNVACVCMCMYILCKYFRKTSHFNVREHEKRERKKTKKEKQPVLVIVTKISITISKFPSCSSLFLGWAYYIILFIFLILGFFFTNASLMVNETNK